MVASTGVIVLKCVSAAASVSSERPSPRDINARISGTPAATNVPKTISSTIRAAISPTMVLSESSGWMAVITSPANATSTPVPASAWLTSASSLSTSSRGTSNDFWRNWTYE